MKLQPIVYVTEMDRSVAWYSLLLDAEPEMTSEHWTSFQVGDAHLALHLSHPDDAEEAGDPGDGNVELSLVVDEQLEVIVQRIPDADEIVQQPFGRSVDVTDPDGLVIQVNEHDPAL